MRHPLSALALLFGLSTTPACAEAPKIVVSIKPLHSLIASIMQGVGDPVLLVRGGASPHDYALKPSDAKALQGADVVFWVGEGLESFLVKPLSALPKQTQTVEVMDMTGLTLLEARKGGAWEAHEHGHEHENHHTEHGGVNAHLWLDPANAKEIAKTVAMTLAARDKANAALYAANAEALSKRLDALDGELKASLGSLTQRRFVVFHDAYQYFEQRYDLNAAGSITVSPDRPPSAKRLTLIRDRIRDLDVPCVFAEPEFEPKLVNTVIEGTKARKGVLDPEGAAIPEGPDLYFTLMRNLAKSLAACLNG